MTSKEFPRKIYLDRIISRKHNGMIKVITGIRRCGKSYILMNLFKRHLLDSGVDDTHIICIELDRFENKWLRDPDILYKHIMEKIGDRSQYYILLDEIQLVTDFHDILNSFLHMENIDCYVTGSNSRFLSSDIVTEFRGRGDEIRIHPLSYSEYVEATEGKGDLNEYMMYGGMPATIGMEDHEQKADYLNRLFEEVYLKDIIDRKSVEKTMELGMVTNILCSSVGSLTNPSKIRDTMTAKGIRMDNNTISNYVGYLEDSFLVNRTDRYDVKGRRYISTPYKFYLEDTGLRNARINFRQFEKTHLMENIIYNELKIRGFSVDVGVVETRKMKGGESEYKRLEIDFVANKGFRRYYIQSAFSLYDSDDKRDIEIRPFLNVDDSFRKIIVTGDDDLPWMDDNGILTIGLKQFLLDPSAMDI